MALFSTKDIDYLDKKTGKAMNEGIQEEHSELYKYSTKIDEVLNDISKGVYHYVSAGAWSTHDLIFKIISQHGPIKLTGATWSMATQVVDKFMKAFDDGDIIKMNFLFDWRVEVRTPEAYSMMKYTNICKMRVASCHAKIAVCEAENFQCVIIGSANFTSNPRIEAGVIDCSKEAVQFHKKWIKSEIEGSKPFGIDTRSLKSDNRK